MSVIMWLQIELDFGASLFTFCCWRWEMIKFHFLNLHRKRENQRTNERAIDGLICYFYKHYSIFIVY